MSVELSSQQRQAIDAEGTPLKVVDPRSGSVYVLVEDALFDRVKSLVSDDLAETYPAQMESAMRAGWSDPVMDEYNNYDQHHRK